MGFWIFMIIVVILTPLAMIGFGGLFVKIAPKEINYVFGYRSKMSMKNNDTWEFAHRYCGNLWRTFGWILLITSAAVMLLSIGKPEDTIVTFGSTLCKIQLAFLICSIFPTEAALKKTFDENGSRK